MPGWAPPAFAAGAAATGAGAAPLWLSAGVPSDVPGPPASEAVGPGASTAAGAPSLVPVGAACPGDDDVPVPGVPEVPALASPGEPDDVSPAFGDAEPWLPPVEESGLSVVCPWLLGALESTVADPGSVWEPFATSGIVGGADSGFGSGDWNIGPEKASV